MEGLAVQPPRGHRVTAQASGRGACQAASGRRLRRGLRVTRLGFTCSYTKLKDVEKASPCGRRATRRKQGEPKCLGHWAVEYLMGVIGGTDHARKTWAVASGFLSYLGVVYLPLYWDLLTIYSLTMYSLVLFSGGILLSCLREHPFGGIICLFSAVFASGLFLRSGGLSFRYYLNSTAKIPAHSSRVLELFTSSVDVEIGFAFIMSLSGFVFLYTSEDRAWMRFTKSFSSTLSIMAFLTMVAVVIASGGMYAVMLPWIVVVLIAIAVARGTPHLKNLAKELAKHIRV